MDPQTLSWIAIPILIFLARVADVSLGTIRVVFISKGYKALSAFVGFFEVLIWLFAIGQIMQNLTNWTSIFAYAAGFAAGTFVGLVIEEKLSFGDVLIRIISRYDVPQIISKLRKNGYKTTQVSGEGDEGEVKVILAVTHRKNIHAAINLIKQVNPGAFYTIEDLKTIDDSDTKQKKHGSFMRPLKLFDAFKKGK